ncbi:MAG: Asp-tRNA(Asn)/Glu-tRNA(Gln) amidotransferase subunit GatB [Deltaproteobacteria bacterium]|nr:Asp-tRNA(Asn)/Glu-tRNA(Gln) amidotransferase subunit GatB [Deltaproteobacteria bacterium]
MVNTGAGGWETVIGLEVHTQLNTRTKLFCRCPNVFGGEPNTRVCPVCAGMPGALPVINSQAVRLALRAGLAMGCSVNRSSLFSRKSYFYPDLPNGYQTSQWEPPICSGGRVALRSGGHELGVRINRLHLENDAGKCLHAGDGPSLVDLNRAGTPLIEIVSEPDLRGPEEAVDFMRHLRRLLVYLGVTDGNMEEGSMRCDVNISLRRAGTEVYGTRAEIKNLNSFNSIMGASRHEQERQREILEAGGEVLQETRHYDPDTGLTRSMRSKEEAPDYRYFPCPDLPPVVLDASLIEEIRAGLPEAPEARQKRFEDALGLNVEEAAMLVDSPGLADYFEAALRGGAGAKRVATLILGGLLPECARRGLDWTEAGFSPERMGHTALMVDEGRVSLRTARELWAELMDGGLEVEVLAERKGLLQVSDATALEEAAREAVEANPAEAAAYRAGKTKLLAFFVGQVMKATRGAGNPALVNELLKKYLEG